MKNKQLRSVTRLGIFIALLVVSQWIYANDVPYSFLQIKSSDGLVNNQISAIFKDSRGFMWFGTSSGLCRYDGNEFKSFTHDEEDSTSIIDNNITYIQETKQGNLLIKTTWEYVIYNVGKDIFIPFTDYLQDLGITAIIEEAYIDQNKNIWLKPSGRAHFHLYGENGKLTDPFENGTESPLQTADFYHDGNRFYYLYSNGEIECFNGQNYTLAFRDLSLKGKSGIDSIESRIYADREGDLWVYNGNEGLFHYRNSAKKWNTYTANSGEVRLTSNLVREIIQDDKGNIWIGADHGGITIYNKSTDDIQTLYHMPEDDKSIAQNSITDLFMDDAGIIWIGTYKNGISYYHESIHKFPHYRHLIYDGYSLPYNDVNCFAEDKKGNLWIGSNGGGLFYYNRKTGKYKAYRHSADNPNSLCADVVVNLYIDNDGLLWIGTFTGGLDCFDGNRFIHYKSTDERQPGLPNDNIWSITRDDHKRIWIGTLGGGIILFNKETGAFEKLVNKGDLTPASGFISHIEKMRNGDMFIGTALGVIFYDMDEQRFINHPYYERETPIEVSNNNITDVYEDSRGLLWVASREGLTMVDPYQDYVKLFKKEDHLSKDIINCIQEDENRAIWVSKSSGLSQIIPSPSDSLPGYDFTVRSFTEDDGLQGKEFNVNASLRTSQGEIIFGGPNGFNIFHPLHHF